MEAWQPQLRPNNFNLEKSSKYQALIAHLQRSGGGRRWRPRRHPPEQPGCRHIFAQQDFENTLHMMIDRESAPLPAPPVEVYNQIRDDYLEDITRTMSGTTRGDPETPANVHMLDLTEQDEILTRYSSHDIQEAYKLTHIERDDISIASDNSSDFELYGADKSDNDDKESSADKKEEIEYTEYDVFGSPWDSDGERWYHERTPPISPKEVISLVSECKL
jgi:hypothetical protein